MLREDSVLVSRFLSLAVLAAIAGCATGGPAHFGQYPEFTPKVAATKGERSPLHVTVQLAKPANVAVFLVAPGRPSTLLFPADSLQPQLVEAGSHFVETRIARQAADTAGRGARAQAAQRDSIQNRGGGRGRGVGDLPTTFGFNQRGYLLIYASQEPLPYSALLNGVSGISVPIDDTDALNTVMKLIRERTHTTGRWAAFATDFPP
jgi:hypothetical protein